MTYKILQYGKAIFYHYDRAILTEDDSNRITREITEKAKEQVSKGKMKSGAFDVEVYDNKANKVNSFLGGTI